MTSLQQRRVLVVEDDTDLRTTLAEALQREGCDVSTCSTGEEALNQLRTDFEVGLVLLDVMLPNMNGWDVLAVMKKEARLADIPVVAMSAARVQAPQADEVLNKPVSLSALLAAIGRYIPR